MLLLFFATVSALVNTTALLTTDPPWFEDAVSGGALYLMRRPDQPAGETSWTVSTTSGSVRWAWYVEEWAGMSSVSQPDSAVNDSVMPATPVTTAGSQTNDTHLAAQNQCSPDVTDYLAVSLFRAGSAGSGTWPAGRSYSSGWSELAAPTVGTGLVNSDFMLIITEAYPGVTGIIDNTLTWDITGGGSYTDKSVNAWVAAYQPASTVVFGVLTA